MNWPSSARSMADDCYLLFVRCSNWGYELRPSLPPPRAPRRISRGWWRGAPNVRAGHASIMVARVSSSAFAPKSRGRRKCAVPPHSATNALWPTSCPPRLALPGAVRHHQAAPGGYGSGLPRVHGQDRERTPPLKQRGRASGGEGRGTVGRFLGWFARRGAR